MFRESKSGLRKDLKLLGQALDYTMFVQYYFLLIYVTLS